MRGMLILRGFTLKLVVQISQADKCLRVCFGKELFTFWAQPSSVPQWHGRSPWMAALAACCAVVCATTGILSMLTRSELEGVIAHEMSHIRNLDVRLMTYAAVLAGSIAMIAQILMYSMWFGGDSDNGNPLSTSLAGMTI